MEKIGKMHLGKNGITENFIETLKSHFKNHKNIKISVLKSGTRDREKLRQMTEEILDKLGKNFTARIIGFTIVVKKWRKNIRN